MISFICSSKYSSSILVSGEGRNHKKWTELASVTVRAENIRQQCFQVVTGYISGSCIYIFY